VSHCILIVDDEPFIRTLLRETLEDLEEEGVELLSAKNGSEAWETIRRTAPPLVFLDVMMPKMSGYEVCRRVKEDALLSNTYVIMLTARGQEVDRARSQEVGADEYVTKPFDPDYIVARARAVLGMPG
jgi:two-component system alkaline phosphatase synthesis response regulator PhoP